MSNPPKKLKCELDSIATTVTDEVIAHNSDDSDASQFSEMDISSEPVGFLIHQTTVNENSNSVEAAGVCFKLLDLGDHCLMKIFQSNSVSIMDLCSITQSCVRLREIGYQIFQRNYPVTCTFKLTKGVTSKATMRRIFRTFGKLMLEVELFNPFSSPRLGLVNAIVENCNNLTTLSINCYTLTDDPESLCELVSLFRNLKKLDLQDLDVEDPDWESESGISLGIASPNGHSLDVFSKCESLVELKVVDSYHFEPTIFASIFPNLQHFECKGWTRDTFEKDFLVRHKSLKSFSIEDEASYDHVELLQSIENCKFLEKLQFQFEDDDNPEALHAIDSDTSLKSLESLEYLRELHMKQLRENGRNVIKLLPKLASTLEVLELENVRKSPGLIAVLSKLEKLRVFKIFDIDELADINDIIKCKQLTEFSFINETNITLDPIKIVGGLDKLTKFTYFAKKFRISSSLYVRLVDAVGCRSVWKDRVLDMKCFIDDDFKDVVQSSMVRVDTAKWYHALRDCSLLTISHLK